MQFQQPVPAGLQIGIDRRRQRRCLGDQSVHLTRIGHRIVELPAEAIEHHAGRRAYGLETGETIAIPAQQYLSRGPLQIGDMQLDGRTLPNSVEAADTLFQQVGFERQIEQHQVMGKLEIASFTAYLRADQHLRTLFGISKESRGAVACNDLHVLVKQRRMHRVAIEQVVAQRDRSGRMGADHQHLVGHQFTQQRPEPGDTWIHIRPALTEGAFRLQLRGERGIGRGAGQCMSMQPPRREPFDGMPRIAEQYASCAVPIDQSGNDLLAAQPGFIAEQIRQQRTFVRLQHLSIEQVRRHAGNRGIGLLLGKERAVVMVAGWIEQAQAPEVPGTPELLGRRGQQQHPRRSCSQGLDQLVGETAVVLGPCQMVRLVDDQKVPFAVERCLRDFGRAGQQRQAAQHALFTVERIVTVTLLEALLVEHRERQVEAAQHLDQPLMHQGIGQHHQHPTHTLGQDHAVQDQAGLDGLAQTDLVGQQNTRQGARCNLGSDIQLVGYQFDTRTLHTKRRPPPHGRRLQP